MLLLLSSKSRRQRSLQMDGKYNLLAKLLSDNSHMPIRVAIFSGKTKADNMYSVREFGNQCLLYSLDEVLRYGDVLNIIQADETDRVVERKEVPLFENDAFREAVINAFVYNLWVSGNEPMLTVFSDRIEILSRGTLALGQTMEVFLPESQFRLIRSCPRFSCNCISVRKQAEGCRLLRSVMEETPMNSGKIRLLSQFRLTGLMS